MKIKAKTASSLLRFGLGLFGGSFQVQDMTYDSYTQGLESKKRAMANGTQYWMARDLMPLLGYSSWDKFENVITRARQACVASNMNDDNHFSQTGNMVEIGSGAFRSKADYFLSRYACYLIAMNAESSKTEVGFAMTYFAVQTRRQELTDEDRRLEVRLRIMEHNRILAGVARKAGVTTFAFFQDAGYRGLYGMGLAKVKQYKGIDEKEELLDRVGRLELSANDLRITLAEHRLNQSGATNESLACQLHRSAGEHVREAIMKEHGQKLEDLPAEPSIKPLVAEQKRKRKKSFSA